MNKFTGPTKIPTYEPKPKSTTTQHFSTSTYTTLTGSGQTTTTQTSNSQYTMTYSSLPQASEPPVNSAAYFEMLQQQNPNAASSYSPAVAAPPHFQGPPPGFGALRDRFKATSISDNTDGSQGARRSLQSNITGSGLSSLRDQYINRAKETTETREESFSERVQNVSRTIAGEQPKQQQYSPPAPTYTQDESQVQSQSVDDQGISSEGAVAEGASSSGASSLENDPTSNPTADVQAS